jgi:hypothetical protein
VELTSGGFWDDRGNLMTYIGWLGNQLGIKKMEDWYDYGSRDLKKNYGHYLLKKFGSFPSLLKECFPGIFPRNFLELSMELDYDWLPWRFENVPNGYWSIDENIIKYLEWLSIELSITSMEDWNLVSHEHLMNLHGSSLISKFGSLGNIMVHCYPDYPWMHTFYHGGGNYSKPQEKLIQSLKTLLPKDTEIRTSYRHPNLKFSNTNVTMELDIYVPSLNLALEYQGEQHYINHYLWRSIDIQREKDIMKRRACKMADITLIEIPFWWDRSVASLKATLNQYFPHVFPLEDQNQRPIEKLDQYKIERAQKKMQNFQRKQ